MKNTIFTTGEIVTIETNLREIEKTLGHPIPGGLIDAADLKDHILRPGEIATICQNFRHLDKNRSRTNYSSNRGACTGLEGIEFIIGICVLGFGLLCCIFGWF